MALRKILQKDDDVLRKKSKHVDKFDQRLSCLVEDMKETLTDSQGMGLAAVQVGILKNLFIIDFGDKIQEFVNPTLSNFEGTQVGIEGCLSCKGEQGMVERPMKVKVSAQNLKGEAFEVELEELDARCACHEFDHLQGILYLDKVQGDVISTLAVNEDGEEE